MNATRPFGSLAILYGLCMSVFAYAGTLSWFQFTHAESTLFTSLLGAFFFVYPFISTWQEFGLNYVDKDEDPFSPSDDYHRRLTNACRMYPACWYLPVIFMFGTFIAFFVISDQIQPIYSVIAAMAFISGLWFVFVYPTARKLFG
ncbi:hypothetical protein [Gimesia sp.]|uniref:hypothetical protein n=1 Tax=Gimesia sp. TaxID=2024833 RepID=UPI003A92728A